MRRTNLTTVALVYRTEQASRQGGHRIVSTAADVTDSPAEAPDSTPALDALELAEPRP